MELTFYTKYRHTIDYAYLVFFSTLYNFVNNNIIYSNKKIEFYYITKIFLYNIDI